MLRIRFPRFRTPPFAAVARSQRKAAPEELEAPPFGRHGRLRKFQLSEEATTAIATDSSNFYEQRNADGTLDLLCLICRALVAENLSGADLPAARETHKCQARKLPVRR